MFLRIPLNSDIIFFHQAGVHQQVYKSGIPPFCKIKKERNNALSKTVYVMTDNRRGEQVVTEDDLPHKVEDLFNGRTPRSDIFFNIKSADVCAIKTTSNVSLPSLPRPIAPRDMRMNTK